MKPSLFRLRLETAMLKDKLEYVKWQIKSLKLKSVNKGFTFFWVGDSDDRYRAFVLLNRFDVGPFRPIRNPDPLRLLRADRSFVVGWIAHSRTFRFPSSNSQSWKMKILNSKLSDEKVQISLEVCDSSIDVTLDVALFFG